MAEGAGPPFASVITRDGEIVAEGANRVDAEGDPTWHGEIAAIREACKRLGSLDLSGCTIYASGEPCPMCAAAIYLARLDRLVFGADAHEERRWDGYRWKMTYAEAGTPTLERSMPAEQMLADEADDVWRAPRA